MAEAQDCPQCGSQLSPEAPQGLCPECLLKAGLSDGRDSALESEVTLPVTPRVSDGEDGTINPGSEEASAAPATGTKDPL